VVVRASNQDASWVTPLEVFRARPTGRRLWERPSTYISQLPWERLWIPQNELENVAVEKEAWVSLLGLLPPRPDPG